MTASVLVCIGMLVAQVDTPEMSTQVRRLVRQLDSDVLAERVDAEKRLVELGPKALSLLPETTDTMSAELKERLERARNKLQLQVADLATTESRVTLDAKQTRVSKLLEEIAKQTGNKVIDFRQRRGDPVVDSPVDVNVKDVPYWQAMDAVLDAAQLDIYHYNNTAGTVAIVGAQEGARKRTTSGSYGSIFRFEPIRLTATRDLVNPAAQGLRVTMEVCWEPRVRPISLTLPWADLKMEGDGKPLPGIANAQGRPSANPTGDTTAVEMSLPLDLPSRDIKTLTKITGKLIATIPGSQETFEFSNLPKLKETPQKKGGVTVVFDSFSKLGDIYDARILVRFEKSANALESHQGWIYSNPAYIEDAKGEVVDNIGIEKYREDVAEVGISYKFDLEGPPESYKFVYKTAAGIVRKTIDFELTDIPLP